MLARTILFVSLAALAGCGAFERLSPPSQGLKLPPSVSVGDGQGGAMRLHLASVVAGDGVIGGFGTRGYSMGGLGSRRHDGIDIRAPNGAPIRAAAEGYVADMGWRGDYGRFILIRHSSRIETAYAHLSRFAQGLSTGARVRQDQVIGYVGTTGNSTGPHLHYEVRRNGKAIDPLGSAGAH